MNKLLQLIRLVRELAAIEDPIYTEEGLRAYFDVLVRFAEVIDILPESVVDKIAEALAEPRTFQLALAVVRFVYGFVDDEMTLLSVNSVFSVQMTDDTKFALDFTNSAVQDWIALIPQIIAIIEMIRKLFAK